MIVSSLSLQLLPSMNYNQGDKKGNFFYIDDVLDRQHVGWLEGLTKDEILIPLCYKTEVILLDEDKKNQVIKVREGAHKDTILTIPYKYQDNNVVVSFLSKSRSIKKTSLNLNTKTKMLDVKNVGLFPVEISSDIKLGAYNLQMPIRPIKKILNSDYFDERIGGSRFVQTWFRLILTEGILEDTFLHYGSFSKGCITVLNNKELSVWNKIYLALTQSRLNDMYVSTLYIS